MAKSCAFWPVGTGEGRGGSQLWCVCVYRFCGALLFGVLSQHCVLFISNSNYLDMLITPPEETEHGTRPGGRGPGTRSAKAARTFGSKDGGMAPEAHKAGAHKRHCEGADITTDITGNNVRVAIARHHLNRFRCTLDVWGQRATAVATGVAWDLNEAMNVEHLNANGLQPFLSR